VRANVSLKPPRRRHDVVVQKRHNVALAARNPPLRLTDVVFGAVCRNVAFGKRVAKDANTSSVPSSLWLSHTITSYESRGKGLALEGREYLRQHFRTSKRGYHH